MTAPPPSARPTATGRAPSPAQRRVLERMALGERVTCHERDGDVWWASDGDKVNQQTFDALIRRGWITSHDPARVLMRYVLSDAGRAALHHEPPATEDER